MRTVYINGEFIPENEAKISIFDRGFLMADAVYEVSAVLGGKLIDNHGHLERLGRSLRELGIKNPYSVSEWEQIQFRLMELNQLVEGVVYIQVTRGVADRDFIFNDEVTPTVVMFTQDKRINTEPRGLNIQIRTDIRWQRRDIKTTQLLAQSWAKTSSKSEGFDDCWFVEDGFITEGSSNNAWIIKENRAITRPASHSILNGITRRALFTALTEIGLVLEERAFTVEEALTADEAFSTSASGFVTPVISIDHKPIGNGKIGEKTTALRAIYIRKINE